MIIKGENKEPITIPITEPLPSLDVSLPPNIQTIQKKILMLLQTLFVKTIYEKETLLVYYIVDLPGSVVIFNMADSPMMLPLKALTVTVYVVPGDRLKRGIELLLVFPEWHTSTLHHV